MILYNPKLYENLNEGLQKSGLNTLFAQSVLNGDANGKVFVDHLEHPQTVYIFNEYSMSWLYGSADNKEFNDDLFDYFDNNPEAARQWIQSSENWWEALSGYANKKEFYIHTRVNFQFDPSIFRKNESSLPEALESAEFTADDFDRICCSESPTHFWVNKDTFLKKGKGFKLIKDGQLVSIAFSAFVSKNQLEIGIETMEGFRGRGYGKAVASELIRYCNEKNIEPVWSCRYENQNSYRLAQRLGFVPCQKTPYYHFSK